MWEKIDCLELKKQRTFGKKEYKYEQKDKGRKLQSKLWNDSILPIYVGRIELQIEKKKVLQTNDITIL